ncbi:MAG: hypothetical protein QG611_803, partial [Bacteroidota bacterium]|nr:hypothetical protein [Bacteroidota bacterium]
MRRATAILFILITVKVSGQIDSQRVRNDTIPERVYLLQTVERDGVSLPEIQIREVTVAGTKNTSRKSVIRRYDRLIYNLKRVYPYSMIVRAKLEEVNEDLSAIPGEKERRQYLKDFEKNIFREYEDDVRKLTITQGRLLLKLIDRETQNTSYDLIKQYRGGLSAAFWQGIARIFGTNLKEEYDPYGIDFMIELLLQDIEA